MTALRIHPSLAWMRVLALALLSTLTALGTAHAEQPAAPEAAEQPAAESVPPPSPRPAAQMEPEPAQQEATAPEPPSPERAQTPPPPSSGYEPPVVTEPVSPPAGRRPQTRPVYYGSFPMEPAIEDDGSCQAEHACGPGHMCHRNRCVPSRVEGYGLPVALGHVLLGPFGSTIAHFAYEQRGKGLTSLGGGVGSFLLGGLFGCRVTVDPCSQGDFVAGAVIVYAAFAIVDIAALAKREVPDLRRSATPILVPSANGLVGGVRTEF